MDKSVDDLGLYVIANKEVDTNTQDDALWRKAMALTARNKEKAKYKYLKLRVQQLKKTGVPKSKVNPKAKASLIKKEKKGDTDTSYEEEIVAEIDEAINKQNKPIENKGNDKNIFNIIAIVIAVIGFIVWIININQLSNSSESTYVEKTPKSNTSSKSDYRRTSYDDKYSLKINTLPVNATVNIMNITPKYSYGMYLKQGDYKVEVSAYGYIKKTMLISLKENTTKSIFLSKNTYSNSTVNHDISKTASKDNKFSVNITTVPEYTTIKIINIKPKFYQGIRLKKGTYNISVSKKGYETYNGHFELTQDSSYSVTLKKKKIDQKYPLTINVTPSDAKVQITNINSKYYDGIMLKKGIYDIRVSKYGYETQEGTVNPFEYTTYDVSLNKKATTYLNHISSSRGEKSNMNHLTNSQRSAIKSIDKWKELSPDIYYQIEETKYNKFFIKGKREECYANFTKNGRLHNTSCLSLTNSKGIKILCTKHKSICKTEDELISSLGYSNSNYITTNKGTTFRVKYNSHGAILKSKSFTIYLGKDCDVSSPEFGNGIWNDGKEMGFIIQFKNREIIFLNQELLINNNYKCL